MKVVVKQNGSVFNCVILEGEGAGQVMQRNDTNPIEYKYQDSAIKWLTTVGHDAYKYCEPYRGFQVVQGIDGKFYVFYSGVALFETFTFHKLSDVHEVVDHHYGYFGK